MSGVVGLIGAMLSAAGESPVRSVSIFDPASPGAESIVRLAWLGFAVAGCIFVVVEGVLLYTVARFRRRGRVPQSQLANAPTASGTKSASPESIEPPQVYGSMPIEVAWTAAPAMIVFFLVLVTARTLWEVNAGADRRSRRAPTRLVVTVIGHQWWWEYRTRSYDGRDARLHHRQRTAHSGRATTTSSRPT